MLSISTVQEAIDFLTKETGHDWTQSQLFDISTKLNLRFRAVVPLEMLSHRWHFTVEAGLIKVPFWSPSHPMLAMVYPHDIASVWQLGAANISHAEDSSLQDGELNLLTSPITVTAVEIRIREDELATILRAWVEAQGGTNWWRVPIWARPCRQQDGNAHRVNDRSQASATSLAPWLLPDPRDADLPPFTPWGGPARYFARYLVKDDPSLLTKRASLAEKVASSLNRVGVKKRGGKLSPDATTVLKAFTNLDFS